MKIPVALWHMTGGFLFGVLFGIAYAVLDYALNGKVAPWWPYIESLIK